MLTDYLRYLQFQQSSFPGFHVVNHKSQSYYICAYGNRFRGKIELGKLLKSLNTIPKYSERDFDFHHIVERLHLADISSSESKVDESYNGMPTVMIHKSEHYRYNRILSAGETRELYMRTKINLPLRVTESEKAVRQMIAGSDKEGAKREIAKRIEILAEIYRGVYEGNEILKIISSNIFNDYQNRLTKI